MADTMQFDLVSPERKLASVEASEVQIPGADGDFTAMPGHAPLITTLRPGILTVVSSTGAAKYVVTGGFAEIGVTGVTVLAERSLAASDMSQETFAGMLAQARQSQQTANADVADVATKLVADIIAMGAEVGLSA
jgi:F-type H+-transporting ATPase subunit epsilon